MRRNETFPRVPQESRSSLHSLSTSPPLAHQALGAQKFSNPESNPRRWANFYNRAFCHSICFERGSGEAETIHSTSTELDLFLLRHFVQHRERLSDRGMADLRPADIA